MLAPGVHPLAVDLPVAGGIPALAAWLEANPDRQPHTASGKAIRFVPPADDGESYEGRIFRCGDVATRADDPHDFFNALVWLNFPLTKAALNARHVASIGAGSAGRRSAERDALTHFDECGALVVARDSELLGLVREFRWQELFCGRRDEVRRGMALVVFGHATMAALAAPFRGLTVKAVLEEVDPAWFERPVSERIAGVDRRIAARWAAAEFGRPRDLHPLPVLGWPGVVAASEASGYYEDSFQFRPGRRGTAVARIV